MSRQEKNKAMTRKISMQKLQTRNDAREGLSEQAEMKESMELKIQILCKIFWDSTEDLKRYPELYKRFGKLLEY